LEKKIIIKEPNGSLGSDIITECLPNSKVILVVRDGRDVLDSRISSLRENSWAVKNYNLRAWPKDKKKSIVELETLAKIWVKRMEVLMKTFESHNSTLRFKIKYEDLLIHTKVELERIYHFIGIEISKEKIEQITKNYDFNKIPKNNKGENKIARFANPGKWKITFTKEETDILNKIMSKTLSQLGYTMN
jgi:hypothetical protein